MCKQLVGSGTYLFNKPVYYAYMARTKQHFGVLVTTITQWWSPTVVRVTGDKSVRHQLKRTSDGRLECEFPERMILIANHQVPFLHALTMTYISSDIQSDPTSRSFTLTGFIFGGYLIRPVSMASFTLF